MTIKLFVDSGAYSCWRRGYTIRLEDYIAFLKLELSRDPPIVTNYVALDIIPGSSGMMDWSRDAVEQSARQSYENLQRMKEAGLKPIPVFHQGEDFKWLERMLNDGEDYIGLSPYKNSHRLHVIPWFIRCFAILKNRPHVRTHGFGVGAHIHLTRYPWTSADSSKWWQVATYGNLLVPIKWEGMYDYSIRPDIVPVTDANAHLPHHLDALDDMHVGFIADYLRDVLGIDLTRSRYCVHTRLRISTAYFKALADWSGVNFIFSTNLTGLHHEILNERAVKSRLLSYYDVLRERFDLDYAINFMTWPPRSTIRRNTGRDLWTPSYRDRRKLALLKRIQEQEGD
jgi:hypothetical protein